MHTDNTADLEIVNTRVIDAPRERLFNAVGDPNQLKLWWGPKGFTNTFQSFEFKPGGKWQYVMHSPTGTDYENESEFAEIVPPERIVLVHLRPMHRFLLTMTFAAKGNSTLLTWRMCFDSAAECAAVKRFVLEANEQNFDRLEAHLAKMT